MIGQNLLFKKLFFTSFIMGSTVLALLTGQQRANAESFDLVWSTEFDAPLKSWEWNIYNNAAFASSKTACFMGSNTYTQDGFLNLVVNENQTQSCSGRPYASGGLDTFTYRAQTFGKWEVRAKMPKGYGVISYIGLFPVNRSWPPEIDFAEYIGKQPNNLFIAQHYGVWPNNRQDNVAINETTLARSSTRTVKNTNQDCAKQTSRRTTKSAVASSDVSSVARLDFCKTKYQKLQKNNNETARTLRSKQLTQNDRKSVTARNATDGTSYWTNDFHTYTLEWVPGELRYYIDGVLQVTQPQRFTETPNMMKLAIGTGTGNCGSWSWIGCPTETATNGKPWPLPAQMQVDYVKIYKYVPESN
jgi:beta-glucanase (GH16 family)